MKKNIITSAISFMIIMHVLSIFDLIGSVGAKFLAAFSQTAKSANHLRNKVRHSSSVKRESVVKQS